MIMWFIKILLVFMVYLQKMEHNNKMKTFI